MVDGPLARLLGMARPIARLEDTRFGVKFAPDSLLEGGGFEPSVPRVMDGDLGRQVPALIAVCGGSGFLDSRIS